VTVIDDVREFLAVNLRVAGAASLAPDTRLIARGVLDSIELMQVVSFLEEKYGIRVEDTEILPDNLGSLAAIGSFVDRKRGAGPSPT
jgi:acyl carrier protein